MSESDTKKPTIEAKDLSRWFGKVIALNDVNVQFYPGVTGLVGPNGAGKTTLLNILAGLIKPSMGNVKVLPDTIARGERPAERIGIVPEGLALYDWMTGLKFTTLMVCLHGFPRKQARQLAQDALETVGLSNVMHRRIATYSRGMRQRAKLAQCIAHDPDLLLLDEPISGMDPAGRHRVAQLLIQFGERGKTVIVSSHVLHEVETITPRIVVLNRGKVLASGDVYSIRELIDSRPHRVRIECDRPRELAGELVGLPHVVGLELSSTNSVTALTARPSEFYESFPRIVLKTGANVRRFFSEDDNLEAVFRYLVGEGGG
ncbi:MAG: ABC transporter ATP-binding protein [Thermoplasmata archaeon]